jgi:two-component system sensor histidine kinase KdpD
MPESRPDPDALLARVRSEDEQSRRARLKVFFGASAGVGKTYAMLVEAHERRRAGTDTVAGLVETHGRSETMALLEGLEQLPRRLAEHRGAVLPEFDLDAALARRPGLVLVDELAHTNAPGSRHRKRWQDVMELLDAGIDVYTTLNVQHVESLIDVVAQVTGVAVRETVPDSVLDRADEVELVDLPPDDLLQRMREGKVYMGEQAGRALEGFFRKGNLIALRELALRQTAQRVDAQMESYRRAAGIAEPWAVRERILVCVGDAERGLRLVRAARRIAVALKAEWIVAHVETPGQVRESRAERDALVDVLGLAEDLGAETILLTGLRVPDELLHFARERHVSRIVVGKPRRALWLAWLPGTLVNRLVRGSEDIDVHVVAGEDGGEPLRRAPAPATPGAWRGYLGAVPVVGLATLVAWVMQANFSLPNLTMVYLLGVTVAAVAFGRGPAIFASILSVLVFDVAFVPPRFQIAVANTEYLVTFAVMLVVAIVIGTLAARTREQAQAARARERRTAALYQMSRDLSVGRTVPQLVESAVARIHDVFGARAVVLRPGAHGRLAPVGEPGAMFADHDHELGVAQWAFDHAQPAGIGTDTLPASHALHLPLLASGRTLGVLSVQPSDAMRITGPDRLQMLQAFANQTAVALEREQFAEQAERARVDAEAERARNALLSSVSHDLRTPLAVITGAATGLRDAGEGMGGATRRELAETIADEARRLNRLVGNLLDMTRLESGALAIRREWHSVEEVIGGAIERVGRHAPGREIRFDCDPALPLVALDDVLFGQAITHLLENALQYAPAEMPVEVTATRAGDALRVEVADRGPGFAPGEEERVFEKFYRGTGGAGRRGTGLGLAICRGIVEAHGGSASASRRPGGGAVIRLEVPLGGEPPAIERGPDEAEAGEERA